MVINDKGRSSSLDTQVCHSKIMIYLGAANIESNKFNNFNNFVNHNDSKIDLVFVGFVCLFDFVFSTAVVPIINTHIQGPGKILVKNLEC